MTTDLTANLQYGTQRDTTRKEVKRGKRNGKNMRDPLVSIVITAYNYRHFLDECLESCFAQTYRECEIVLVDDGSTDGTENMVSAPGYTVIHHDRNRGYAVAKNTGVLAAKGEYIVMIDADDKLTPESVEVRLKTMLCNPKIDFVSGRCMRWYGGDDIRGYNAKTKIHAQGWMYRKSLHDRVGLFYEPLRSKADKEFVFRLGIHPESPLPKLIKYRVIADAVALYRKHENQMHKVRKYVRPEINKEVNRVFDKRIRQLKREGITVQNTRFP